MNSEYISNFKMESYTDQLIGRILASRQVPAGKRSDVFLFRNLFFCSESNTGADYENDFDVFKAVTRQAS